MYATHLFGSIFIIFADVPEIIGLLLPNVAQEFVPSGHPANPDVFEFIERLIYNLIVFFKSLAPVRR
jgi:hypothetical protein